MDEIINERQKDIRAIAGIMNDIKDIAGDFVVEVND